ncbi:unnamed protein product [Aphanomyces euteiches]|uniref:Uncharacterized protein n=1 Tax=Aphanomyces euteiches TaxID=100861 RepID=A0A6G0X040_9STRA|nr:hypothetical protein Ae201684_009961 [Aphanomyces euteiches]KAH9095976.1 hypothetical protein Ae201684P_010182 [Aphanomyces euteiches]
MITTTRLEDMEETLHRVCARLDALERKVDERMHGLQQAMAVLTQTLRQVLDGTSPPSTKKEGWTEWKLPEPQKDDKQSLSDDDDEIEEVYAVEPSWKLPVTTCRTLWRLWFHGDATLQPLYEMDTSCLDRFCRRNFTDAEFIVRAMVEDALTHGLIDSTASLALLEVDECMELFDKLFPLFFGARADGSLSRPGFLTHSFAQVASAMYTSVAKKLKRSNRQETTSTEPSEPSEYTRRSPDIPPCAGLGSSTEEESRSESEYEESDNKRSAKRKTPLRPPPPRHDEWMFPSTTCRELWRLWFHGDDTHGPFHTLDGALTNATSQHRFNVAKRVIEQLVAAAVRERLIASIKVLTDMPENALMVVFGGAFRAFFRASPRGMVTTAGFEHCCMDDVLEMPYLTIVNRLEQSSTAAAAVETTLPLTNCRDLWRLWFLGDGARHPRPLKERFSTTKDETSKRRYAMAKRVVGVLTATAVKLQLTTDAALAQMNDLVAVMEIFDQAFQRYFQPGENGRVAQRGFRDCRFDKVKNMHYDAIYDRLQTVAEQSHHRFTWSDGATRRAPENWMIPSITCQELWRRWFHGDMDSGVGPYRALTVADMHDKRAKKRYYNARVVVDKLVAIAKANAFFDGSLEALAEDESMVVFERAFIVLMHNNPDGNLAGRAPGQIRPENADACMFQTVARELSPSAHKKRKQSELE